jgi:hypothetical protein
LQYLSLSMTENMSENFTFSGQTTCAEQDQDLEAKPSRMSVSFVKFDLRWFLLKAENLLLGYGTVIASISMSFCGRSIERVVWNEDKDASISSVSPVGGNGWIRGNDSDI